MDKASLVSIDVERGAEILDILDHSKVTINVALWMHLAEYGDWRMVLSAKRFNVLSLRQVYGLIDEALNTASFPLEKTPPLLILPLTDPFIKHLRTKFAKAKSVDGMRLGSQMIGDRFVEDAYVYRIS